MPARNPRETFVLLLSHVRRSTERAASIFSKLGNFAEDPHVKDALEARAFVSQSVLSKLDQCFKLIGEKPAQLSGRLEEIFLEDFRKELNEIQSTAAKRLFVLAGLVHLVHLQIGEFRCFDCGSRPDGQLRRWIPARKLSRINLPSWNARAASFHKLPRPECMGWCTYFDCFGKSRAGRDSVEWENLQR